MWKTAKSQNIHRPNIPQIFRRGNKQKFMLHWNSDKKPFFSNIQKF